MMSNETYERQPEQPTAALAEQIMELAAEQAMLRESIVTAAEWDNQSRQVRQGLLDETLHSVRKWTEILVALVALLAILVVIVIVLSILLLNRVGL
jgi:hypothetical protein